MKLEFYSQDKLKKEIINIVSRYLDLKNYRVFFFGSRVRGDNFPRSDIDIGIQGPKEIPPDIKFKIQDEIDRLPTLYRFDLVDFRNTEENFKKLALKHIEYLQ